MATTALLISREQAESILKHLLNALDHDRLQSVMLVSSDEGSVHDAYQDTPDGYITTGDLGQMNELPAPDTLYVGSVYVVGMGSEVSKVLEVLGHEDGV